MSVTFPDNFKIDAWYRGTKNVKVVQCHNKYTLLSNGDKFTKQGNEIYLNGNLLTNMPNISPEDLAKIYTYYLKKKGYKILESATIKLGEYKYSEENHDDDYYFNYFNNEGNEIAQLVASREWNCYFLFENELTEDEYNKHFPSDSLFNIQEVKVDRNHRGKGLAKKLMLKAIDKAKELKHDVIYLNANAIGYYEGLPQNELINFYQRLGFEILLDQGKNCLMILKLSVNENQTQVSTIEYDIVPYNDNTVNIRALNDEGEIGSCFCELGSNFVILELLVVEQYRKKGIARQLLMLAESKAKESGYNKIILEAKTNIHENGIPQDKLESFYRSCGYKYDYSTKRKIMYKTI